MKSQLEVASELVTATGARMVFLTAPCTDEGEQPDGAPWPEDNPARLAAYNRLVREVAAEHPTTDSVVDLYAAAARAASSPATVDGVVIRRTDGVHFTDAGRPVPGAQDDAGHRGRRPGAGGRASGAGDAAQPAVVHGRGYFGFTLLPWCRVAPFPPCSAGTAG